MTRLLCVVCLLAIASAAHADDVHWTGDWGYAEITCDACGTGYVCEAQSLSDAESELQPYICESCGYCSENGDMDCYMEWHCSLCQSCIELVGLCEWAYYDRGMVICLECAKDQDDVCCPTCGQVWGDEAQQCECEYSLVEAHCTNCHTSSCHVCGLLLTLADEPNPYIEYCETHEICWICWDNDPDHCKECHTCDSEICGMCNLCEDCAESAEKHCPECDFCFGDDEIHWCETGGSHCARCCTNNDWKCEQCGECTDARGVMFCDECGLCEECCLENSENADCTHGYCVMSSDYEDHLCRECQQCPNDTECEDCGLCEECQQSYHCEHEMCPESFEYDEHVCEYCGDCYDEDELCEYCRRCPTCAEDYHCVHEFCPEDEGSMGFEHFICEQCKSCYVEEGGCPTCELCLVCCEANAVSKGCLHGLCVATKEFTDHWCYADGQCLEMCQHDSDCKHEELSTGWQSDANAHWQICLECGATVNKDQHSDGEPETIVEPVPEKGRAGVATVSCSECGIQTGTISLPCVEVPKDGSPYIIIQPKDYTGKVSTEKYGDQEAVKRYATFTVKAGGKDLQYQWGKVDKSGNTSDLTNGTLLEYDGVNTNRLTVLVSSDDCVPEYRYLRYYCEVINEQGNVTTDTVQVSPHHVYGRYEDMEDGTHAYRCMGSCDGDWGVKYERNHKYGEWTVVSAATSTAMGLKQRKCLYCTATNSTPIPKVEPGHQHVFDQAYTTSTKHQFYCKCGVASPTPAAAHTFGTPTVTVEPTEDKFGQQKKSCTVCGLAHTERLDKLPHTHDWYDLSYDYMTRKKNAQGLFFWEYDQEKCGANSTSHFVHCKKCDQTKNSAHSWGIWEQKAAATATKKGLCYRSCEECNYTEYQTYDYGMYPVLIYGGTASPSFAKKGATVTITYTKPSNAQLIDYPSKLYRWEDGVSYTGSTTMEWDGKYVTLPRITFANASARTTTFVMPDGLATVAADVRECKHTGSTKMSARKEASCAGYGHEPDKLCADCDEVLTAGARIEPTGHVAGTPISGTEKVVYCSTQPYQRVMRLTDKSIKGYSGDYQCTACGKTVKGKSTPQTHGCLVYVTRTATRVVKPTLTMENAVEATCLTDGYSGDVRCNFCNEVAQYGSKVSRTGHNWGEWKTIREATTKLKGMEERVCASDASHTERRLTDFSGPDYTLTADKAKLHFSWTYGEEPAAQTVSFTSKGRNAVKALTGATSTANLAVRSLSGLQLSVKPNAETIKNGDNEVITIQSVTDTDNTSWTGEIIAPSITVTYEVKKAQANFHFAEETLNAETGTQTASPAIEGLADGMTIQYSSSDNSVATIDAKTGKVTPLKEGATTITATFAGNANYKPATASYTLTVTMPTAIRGVEDKAAATDADGNIYDLQGRKVQTMQPNNVYVIDGKKELK